LYFIAVREENGVYFSRMLKKTVQGLCNPLRRAPLNINTCVLLKMFPHSGSPLAAASAGRTA